MSIEEDLAALESYEDDDGELAERVASLRKKIDASPLRADLKEANKKLQQKEERIAKLNNFALSAAFKEVGLKYKPEALKLPDDLDPTDTQALSAWATDAGFLEKQPDTPTAEQEQHQRVEEAVTGAAPSGQTATKQTEILSTLDPTKLSEEEFWAKADELKVTLQTQK